MTLDEIRELIQIVTETGIAELEVQRGEDRVRIRRTARRNHDLSVAALGAAEPAQSQNTNSAPVAPPAFQANTEKVSAASLDEALDAALVVVKSPIVGTFYESASPGSPPFVRIGDTVRPGQVLCIIESMKLMNEIEAEIAGVIAGKLVGNAQPVEYGEALFTIRPV
jgi:acetyl-CoA carboxylase biotin carboxyl carrier protein